MDFFSSGKLTLHKLRLVEFENRKPWIQRVDCKIIHGFLTAWGGQCP